MKKKTSRFLIITCLLLMLCALTVSAAEVSTIGVPDELLALMNDSAMWNGSYKLTDDIDLSEYDYEAEGALTQKPIGNANIAFTGSFDGDGHTISGIDISSTAVGGGLFGIVSDDGDTTVIKNLTIKGSVVSTANFAGGLIGIICGATELDGIISDLTTFTPVSRAGGIVGGIVNNGYAAISTVANSEAYNVTFKNCTNKTSFFASLTAEARAGGIVGSISTATAGRGANEVYFENCVNYGDIKGYSVVAGIVSNWDTGVVTGCTNKMTNCKNYGNIEATAGTAANNNSGGIIGFAGLQLSTVDGSAIEVTNCYNEGTITADNRSGGIVGYANGGSESEMLIIDGCYNAGTIQTTGSYNAGILGVARATVKNCYNSGNISGSTYIGGIAGFISGTFNIFNYNYTDATVTATGTTSIGNAFGGYASNSSSTSAGNYYSGTDNGDIIAAYISDFANTEEYSNLNTEGVWLLTTSGPELEFFHEHTDADENNICDVCQGEVRCLHSETTQTTQAASTCAQKGSAVVVCNACGETVNTVELPIDETAHTSESVKIVYTAETQNITYTYECCGKVIFEDSTAGSDVYVKADGIAIDVNTTFESSIGITEEKPFADFETAMKYAAASVAINEEAIIHILDTAVVSGGYKTPEYTGMITITGGKLEFNTASRRFFANGGITFKDLTICSNTDTDRIMFFAQNNEMVFDEGVVMGNDTTLTTATGFPNVNSAKIYVYGGYEGKSGEINSNLTIRSGDFWFVGGWNAANVSCTNSGESKITVGKTNADDYLYIDTLVAFSTGPQQLTEASKATVIFDGKADMRIFCYGNLNNVTDANYADVLFETDVVLKGDINETASEAVGVVNLDSNATTTNTKLNVYTDRRVDTAISESYLFLGGDPNGNITADATIAARGTDVSGYSYINYCQKYYGHTSLEESCEICGGIYGDVNGDTTVDIVDVLIAIKVAVNDDYIDIADVDADGKITLIDVLRILKKSVK
ncbi:MAG: dockerin type I repeat-containing protein [Clostridia bacterium]|nr:dockerin type I repeat-containing protein [Clostridia bacterium]